MTPAPAPAPPQERRIIWHRQPVLRPGTFRYSVTRTTAHQLECFDGVRWQRAVAPR